MSRLLNSLSFSLALAAAFSTCASAWATERPPNDLSAVVLAAAHRIAAERPNIILMMVDDMGFSDLGCYGGEIETPNIDKLAAGGVRFSHFYNNSRCCPTRATLLTGLPTHQTGVGHMVGTTHDFGEDFPNYRGALNRNCVTLAEALKPAGYATLMAGKWHLGSRDESFWPMQRGFEKFYGSLMGATRFFHPISPRHITSGNTKVEKLVSTTDRPYYTTDAFTDYAIKFVDQQVSSQPNRPFFLYLAYTAPHWPHQAHEQDIDKYRGKYMMGWDKLRQQRYQRQIELGLIDPKWKLSPRDPQVPGWDTLTTQQQKEQSLRMAVYAAMIDRVDQNIGKLTDKLNDLGIADNTLILFLSDNGACQEGSLLGNGKVMNPELRNMETSINYGRVWANASSTPFRLYKHYTHEGGAATPFLMHWPNRIKPQTGWYESNAHLVDIMPTLLELAGADYPTQAHGNEIPPLPGISLTPAMDGKPLQRPRPLFSEHENNAFVIDGDWKLVGQGVSARGGPFAEKWEFYNLKHDRTELNDLAAKESDRAEQMARAWKQWAEEVNVFPKPEKKKPEKTKKRRERKIPAT